MIVYVRKKEMNTEKMIYIPEELVNIIADYHDYEKYCKPEHYEKLKGVINDIGDMACIMPDGISPYISSRCWGPKGLSDINN